MKSSKIENIFNYNSSSEDKTASPLTYYQPFQTSFDPEFPIASPKPTQWPNTAGCLTNIWNQGPERPTGGSHIPGGIPIPWDIPTSSSSQPSAPPLSELKDSFSVASTSCRKEPEGRILCNTTWLNPVSPKPSFSGCEDTQRSVMSNVGRLAMYSPFPSFGDGFVGGTIGSRLEEGLFGTKTAGTSDVQVGNPPVPCYPFMLGTSGSQMLKTGHSRPMMCNFCKNNKEVPDIYLNHYLYDPETKKLSCPVLRKHVCEVCGGTGDQAHTLQYCPLNRQRGLQTKVPVLLKNRTITNSTGKIRRN